MGNSDSVLPGWVPEDYEIDEDDFESLSARVKELSSKKESFLETNAEGVDASFSLESYSPRIESALQWDEKLKYVVPKLVPKHVSEETFWNNYFSNVNEICASYYQEEEEDTEKRPPKVSVETNSAQTKASTVKKSAEPKRKKPQKYVPLHPFVKSDVYLFKPYEDLLNMKGIDEHSASRPDIRWGIIGLGDVCVKKAGPAFNKCDGSRLVAGSRRNREEGLKMCNLLGIPENKFYADYKRLISDPDVDAVYISTPVQSHLEIALEVLKYSKPCFVEKPICRNCNDAEDLTLAFHKKNVPLYVAYYRRAHPRFIRARTIINQLGPLTTIQYTYHSPKHTSPSSKFDWRINPEISGGGLFMDIGCHVLDILDFLFNRLENVQGDCLKTEGKSIRPENLKVETCIVCSFRTLQGAIGNFLMNFCSPRGFQEDKLVVTGVHGKMEMSIFGSEPPVLSRPYETPEGVKLIGKPVNCPSPPDHVHQPLLQCICNELREVPSAQVISSGESACRTARIMDSILRKFYS